jgi:hypothetical protein
MKHKFLTFAAAGFLAAALTSSVQAAFITIAPGMKAIYTNEIIDGKVVVVGALTVSTLDDDGHTVFKTYKETTIPAENGQLPQKMISEIAMTVTPQLDQQGHVIDGQYTVTTTTTVTTAPVNTDGSLGTAVITTPPAVVQNNVEQVDAPPTSIVSVSTTGLATTPAVSGQ